MFVFKRDNLKKAVEILKQGKILIFPTETSYGLGCDATRQGAVDRIFEIKGRRKTKPLLSVVSSIAMAKKYLRWDERLDKLAKKYWPGPLTIVGEATEAELAKGVVSEDGATAMRVINHPVARFLSEQIGRPLVATSANISEAGDIYDAGEIIKIFKNSIFQPDAILDYGELPRRKPSTVISVVGGDIKILRQGEIKIKINALP